MIEPLLTVKRPRVTEKSHWLTEKRSTYVFEVDRKATKDEIRKAIETLYAAKGIHVLKVRTMVSPGKSRRYRMRQGRTSAFKKALVTLRPGETIDIG